MGAIRRRLSEQDRVDWLQLIRSENVGPSTFWRLLETCGSANQALNSLPDFARRGGLKRKIRKCSTEDAEREFTAIKKLGGHFIAAGEPDYPKLLETIHAPPPLICVMGQKELLERLSIAIVGARNASAVGRRIAEDFARALGASGTAIVSGLARGIDTSTHRGSLETGTIAVMAGGVDAVYPLQNKSLYEQIKVKGLLLSEMPLGHQAQARDFPRRNRMISGLAVATIVVEASMRSGSLITARFAAEQGREVFAVPGSPLDPRHQGTNALIRDGANLVENAEQVIEALDGLTWISVDRSENGNSRARPRVSEVPVAATDIDEAHVSLSELLSPEPVLVDELIRQSDQSPAAVHAALLELELAGRLERHSGGLVSLL